MIGKRDSARKHIFGKGDGNQRVKQTGRSGLTDNTHQVVKAQLRVELLRRLKPEPDTWFYVPFSGYCKLPKMCRYPTDRMIGVEVDQEAIDWSIENYPDSKWFCVSANMFDQFEDMVVSFADFDSYHNPYRAITQFRNEAELTDRFGIVVTDAVNRKMLRGGYEFDFYTGKYGDRRKNASRQFVREYWTHNERYFEEIFSAEIVWKKQIYRPIFMRYIGYILERRD